MCCAQAQAIGEALLRNSTMSVLNLEHNSIGDEGVQCILAAFQGGASKISQKELELWREGLGYRMQWIRTRRRYRQPPR